jgi:hypothetical protein
MLVGMWVRRIADPVLLTLAPAPLERSVGAHVRLLMSTTMRSSITG